MILLLKAKSVQCGNSSIGRVAAFQAVGCGFESRFPLQHIARVRLFRNNNAGVAQLVEQLICNQQVAGSNPAASSIEVRGFSTCFLLFFFLPLVHVGFLLRLV